MLNYAPGPLDTDMQAAIREDMPNSRVKDIFVDMKKAGTLVKPDESAMKLLRILESNNFTTGDHIDYYDAC